MVCKSDATPGARPGGDMAADALEQSASMSRLGAWSATAVVDYMLFEGNMRRLGAFLCCLDRDKQAFKIVVELVVRITTASA